MTLETCRTVAHSKLEMTQPAPLDFLSGAVASVDLPLAREEGGGNSHWAGARSWSLGGAECCYLCGVVRFFGVLFLRFGWQGWGGW